MAAPKTTEFSIKAVELSRLAKALSHPARIEIMEMLLKVNSCICGDIVDQLPLSQSTVSQHLSALKEAGLIRGEIDGPRVCYCVDMESWNRLGHLFGAWVQIKPCGPDGCC